MKTINKFYFAKLNILVYTTELNICRLHRINYGCSSSSKVN